MAVNAISISGPIDVIEALAARLSADGVHVSEPTELDAADVLNAPWNKAKVVAVSGVITAMLELGAGSVALADSIASSLHSTTNPTTVIVIDNPTQPTGGQNVQADATPAQILQAIGAVLPKQ